MPNKLPELYLYRLIPGAKQPSRWHIKSRYPVPPAVPSLLAPAPAPVNVRPPSISGPDGSKLTTSNGIWSNSPTSYTYQWFRVLQPSDIQLINSQTTDSYTTVSDDVGFKIYCQVVATNVGGASAPALSNAISVSMPPSDQNLDNDELLAIDEPTAPGKPTLTIIGNPILTQVAGGLGLLDVTASIRVTFATNTGDTPLKYVNAYMMVNKNQVATINRSITSENNPENNPENNTFVDIELKSNNITHGVTVDLTASVVNESDKTSVSNSVSFMATLREFEFYRSKNY